MCGPIEKGDVLTVEFTDLGIPCLGLNDGPAFKHNEAVSFQIATEDQEGPLLNAIVSNGGSESQRAGARTAGAFPHRSPPRALLMSLRLVAFYSKRAIQAMMKKKIDIAAIEAASRG